MSKYSAEEFSRAGQQFLGRPYADMDCQEFVERCLECVGCVLDLKGSNAWFRKIQAEGWTGSPEECIREFGSVPKGAFLFIHAFDGGEECRGYHDGKGNASHIGIKTGQGKGAIHSSASRACVAESEFHDKTIRNGGWNMVGLWNRMDYGKTVNWVLEHSGLWKGPTEQKEEMKQMKAVVVSPNGGLVNLRKSSSKKAPLVDQVLPGAEAEVLLQSGDWTKIRVSGRTGWMMTEFLQMDEGVDPAVQERETYCVTVYGLDRAQAQELCDNYPGRSTMEVSRG